MWSHWDIGQDRKISVRITTFISLTFSTSSLSRPEDEKNRDIKPNKIADNLAQAVEFILAS